MHRPRASPRRIPTLDVNGHDAAQKLAILAWVAWGRWRSEGEVQTQGIVGLDVAPGAVVRLVAEATPDALRVAPIVLPAGSSLAALRGVECALEVEVERPVHRAHSGSRCRGPRHGRRGVCRSRTACPRRAPHPGSARPVAEREGAPGRRSAWPAPGAWSDRCLPVHPDRCRPAGRTGARVRNRGRIGPVRLERDPGPHPRRSRGFRARRPLPGHRWRGFARAGGGTRTRGAAGRRQLERLSAGSGGPAGRAGGQRRRLWTATRATWWRTPTAPRPRRSWPSPPSATWPGWRAWTSPRTRR